MSGPASPAAPAPAARSYGQRCGLSLSLDLLGERWTLLVLRELSRGPKRFRDLLDGLSGIGTNLLAARLKRLEAAQLVQRTTLTAGVPGYELAERGRSLEPILEDLALWGAGLLEQAAEVDLQTRAAWIAMSMRAHLVRSDARAPDGLYAFTVGDERFWLRVAGDVVELRDGPAPLPADVTVETDLPTFARAALGDAAARRALHATGDRARLGPLLKGFRLPAHAAGALPRG